MLALLALVACKSPQGHAKLERATEWPTVNGNAAQTKFMPEGPEPPLKVRWKKSSGRFVWALPVTKAGMVYEVGYNGDGPGKLLALDADTGKLKWSSKRSGLSPGLSASTAGKSLVFAFSQSGTSDSLKLYAFNATTGSVQWTSNPGKLVSAEAIESGGLVFVGAQTSPKDLQRVFALDARTGKKKWSWGKPGFYPQGRGLAAADGILYASIEDKGRHRTTLFAFDALTGREKWSWSEPDFYAGPPAVSADSVYITGHIDGAQHANVLAIDAKTGKLRWKWQASGAMIEGPSAGGERVYVTDHVLGQGMIVSLSANTGKPVWTSRTSNLVFSDLLTAGGIIYAVGSAFDGSKIKLLAIDAETGQQKWQVDALDKQYDRITRLVGTQEGIALVHGDSVIVYGTTGANGTIR